MISKKKIVIVINALSTGGAENQVVSLLKLLGDEFEFHVITILKNDEDYIRENIDTSKVTVHTLNYPPKLIYFPAILFRMMRLLGKLKPDLVHSILFQSNILSRLAAIFGKYEIINTIYDNAEVPAFNLRMLKLTNRLAGNIFIDNSAGRSVYIQKKIVRPEQIFFTPNGIDLPAENKTDIQLKEKILHDIRYSENDILWLNVARFVSQKDHATLVKAFRLLVDSDARNKLLLVGDGRLVQEVFHLVREMKLENNVFYIGRVNDIFTLCSISTGYVCSSTFEGMPIIIMQAMLYRLLVVSTSVGAIPDLIENEVTGYLCKRADPAALAAAMSVMINAGEQKNERIRTAAFNKISEEFSLRRLGDNWYNNYSSVLKKSPK